jgi:2-haloacid dehalogenase/putative hydrolase of the HAD superfamily
MFDAILIDFYGTICAGDREAVEASCRRIVDECGLPLSTQDFAVRWGERFFETVDRSNHGAFQTLFECELESLRTTLADCGHRGKDHNSDAWLGRFLRELEEYWADPPVYPDAVEFLNAVDRPVCCVSNADTRPLMAAIDRLNLRFDAVIASEAVRCYKPDPEIFGAAMRKLGVAREGVVHVGDSLHSDVDGAARVGLKTVWVRRNNRIHDVGCRKPDYTIVNLAELKEIVR